MLQASPCSVCAASSAPGEAGLAVGKTISNVGCAMNADPGIGHNADGQLHADDVVVSVDVAEKTEFVAEGLVTPSMIHHQSMFKECTGPQATLPANESAISKDVKVVGLPGSCLQGLCGRVRGYDPATDTCLVEFSWEHFHSTGDVKTSVAVGDGNAHAERKSTKERFRVKNKALAKPDVTDADSNHASWEEKKVPPPSTSQEDTEANAAATATQKCHTTKPAVYQHAGRNNFNKDRNSKLLDALHIDNPV